MQLFGDGPFRTSPNPHKAAYRRKERMKRIEEKYRELNRVVAHQREALAEAYSENEELKREPRRAVRGMWFFAGFALLVSLWHFYKLGDMRDELESLCADNVRLHAAAAAHEDEIFACMRRADSLREDYEFEYAYADSLEHDLARVTAQRDRAVAAGNRAVDLLERSIHTSEVLATIADPRE